MRVRLGGAVVLSEGRSAGGRPRLRHRRRHVQQHLRRHILTTYQSDAGSAGVFSRWTNRTQEAWVCSHDGPITRRTRGYGLTTDQSDAGSA
eukprot:1043241-Prorocentrum_minimum.AAC.1